MAEEAGGGSGGGSLSERRGGGGEISRAVGSGSMDSLESRWVLPGEDESEIEDEEDTTDVPYGAGVDSEHEDSPVQRLIRTEPRVDSFDVEALEVHGAHRSDYEVSLLPNQVPSDTRISGFMLKVPSPELERSLKIKDRLETSLTLKKLLLMLVLVGTSMVIADGVVTPAMSVMSSIGGLKVGVGAIEQSEVVMISVVFLVILFSVQKFGTSQVGHVVGPALFIWFCSLAGIGIYNLVKHDASVLRAFNPVHIYLYFKRNSANARYALGGCLLCTTGSEAMFADLCYFSVRSVQWLFAAHICLSRIAGAYFWVIWVKQHTL
ncbi:potassium transporter 7-like isoform X2 [Hibiscus syriacus]|uniref:Potassium transporter 7-like isoform X2 n=1 Tax=Hibiscus syriacus TaxID=106335 RepID=A0A6A3BWL6_HIBSY|nr:potassium transporter 7-like isoform X2 [Hibiscus syriacus]